MTAKENAPLHQVSITLLLKKLVSHTPVDEHEIEAARALISRGEVFYTQRVLFLGLLKARAHHDLNTHESQLLEESLDKAGSNDGSTQVVSIGPLLRRLFEKRRLEDSIANAAEIANAIALIFDNKLSASQCSLLLGVLAYTGEDREPHVLAQTAEKMRIAAAQVDRDALHIAVDKANKARGGYGGGLCDIVGTGGDGHSTFNVSTTASVVASSYLLLSKHGNRASSSTSGSADLLQAIPPTGPKIETVTAQTLPSVYEDSSYAFLFAPKFHSGMRHVAPVRRELGIRTIFNVLGPLANPVEGSIEARLVGVAEQSMGPIFAEALRLSGARKAMIVCGAENLDEISCAGKTYCWRLYEEKAEVKVEGFELEPLDFGLPPHPLSEVAGGKLPGENARILVDLLENKLGKDNPVLHFVLINTAALFAIAGLCEDRDGQRDEHDAEQVIRERGPGGQRWKEGVRLARRAIESGEALRSLQRYIEVTNSCKDQ